MWGIFPIQQERLGHFPRPVWSCLFAALATASLPAAALAAAPVIDSLTALSGAIAPGSTVAISLTAHDPDCDGGTCTSGCGQTIRSDLTLWSADDGLFTAQDNGVSASPYAASADWQAPDAEGTYTISVDVADSGTFLCGGRQSTTGTLQIQVTTQTGNAPVIDTLDAQPGQILPDGSSTLTCAASDADGDPLAYSWSADGGQLSPGVDGSASFASSEPGLFTITCTAIDPVGLSGSASTHVSVTAGVAERSLHSGLTTPVRMALTNDGEVYVVDRGAGRLSVLDLATGRALYSLPFHGATSVAVDWAGRLLVGTRVGARVVDPLGEPALTLDGDAALGGVSDVAVDMSAHRFAVLHPSLGRIAIYDETGVPVAAFGTTGDGAGEMRGPSGLAIAPDGSIVVADSGHGLVHVFSPGGALERSFGGLGGGAGQFVRLDDVAVDADGHIYASDSFQDWVQVFDAQGVARDTLGTYGDATGELRTASGLAISPRYSRLLVASSSGSRLELFRTAEVSETLPPGASPQVTPSALSFAPQPVGHESEERSVTLSNVGGSRLGITAVSISDDFAQTSDCGIVLDVGASCTLSLRFRPTASGLREGSLVIETSGEPLRVAVALAGEGRSGEPRVALAPGALAFEPQPVGTSSVPQRIELTNVGGATLTLSGITVHGEFAVSSPCPTQLPPGTSCPIDVRFAPVSLSDAALGSLSVASDADGSPHTVPLSASSTPAVPMISIAGWQGDEGAAGESTNARFAVTLSRPTSVPVEVTWSTADRTALAGEDYDAAAGTLTIAPGETAGAVQVAVHGDALLEPDEEWFQVLLSGASGGEIAGERADAVIRDDEACLSENLLANPGAELPELADGSLPGWRLAAGAPWRRQSPPPTPVDGSHVFYTASSEPSELVQDIDVSSFAQAIDAGSQRFLFEAWVRTLYETTPTARIQIEYRDLDNLAPLEVADSGTILSPTAWTHLEDERPVPPGTGWIRIRLFNLAPGVAYYDALSLRSVRAATVAVDDVSIDEGDSGFRQALFPVRLACPYYQPVRLRYVTRDETAQAREDYIVNLGELELAPGDTSTSVPVEIVGDLVDEPTETFALDFDLAPGSTAVLPDRSAQGSIRNDDFSPIPARAWLAAPESWPSDHLQLGDIVYDREAIARLLGYEGPDVLHRLARQLAAAKLNLERGSKSGIVPVVEKADQLLERLPLGSEPSHDERRAAHELAHRLADYNEHGSD